MKIKNERPRIITIEIGSHRYSIMPGDTAELPDEAVEDPYVMTLVTEGHVSAPKPKRSYNKRQLGEEDE